MDTKTQISRAFFRLTSIFLIYLLVFLPVNLIVTSPAYAAVGDLPIVPDGSTNTVIIPAASGVDIVNIAAPTGSSRVSRNNFSDYNVNPSGLVLNNASVRDYGDGAYRTDIAGLVIANSHLRDSGAANVILNQVTSNRITQINGFTEIAGRKADLIIANPNGIMINGGGFINTDRLAMVVGSEVTENDAGISDGSSVIGGGNGDLYFGIASAPHIESGFLPKITISGDGIDLTGVRQTDFVANLIEITSGVYAGDNDVYFLAGDDVYDHSNNIVTSLVVDPSSTSLTAQIAIDASSLSQIQAGNIFMVATKEGFGVKYSGEMIANLGAINISANGDVEFEGSNIARSISATSENGDIELRGSNTANSMEVEAVNGNITNYDGAELIIGSGGLTFRAINGSINQLANISVDGNHNITAYDYSNSGRIDISGDLIMNIANDLVNDVGALIYAGNDMFLNIGHNLTNNEGAAIYAGNDLTIRRLDPTDDAYDVNDNRINKLENISGSIESYLGDINIEADEIINRRSSIYTQNFNRWIGPCSGYQHETHCSLHEEASFTGNVTREAKISAGGDININNPYDVTDLTGTSLTNQSSAITANGNINIKIGTLDNSSNTFRSYTKYLHHNYWWQTQSNWITRLNGLPYIDLVEESFSAIIKAGGSANIDSLDDVGNTDEISNSRPDPILERNIGIVNNLDITNILENGGADVDFAYYFEGGDYQGIFQKNPNPNSPLFESRSQFIDQDKFFVSDYFYEELGIDLEEIDIQMAQNNERLIGDQFFQANIVERQLKNMSKNNYLLSESQTDFNQEMKGLVDNSAEEYERLGLTLNESLSQDQIDDLEKDILWYETQEIDGETYVGPKIYLSKTTRDRLRNEGGVGGSNLTGKSVIYAKNDVNITATNGKISNSGSIIAGNNVALESSGNINNNNFSEIKAGNDVTLISNDGSIINRSVIASDTDGNGSGDITMSAANNVFNLATVETNASNLLAESYELDGNGDGGETVSAYISNGAPSSNTGDIRSKLIETASLSGNNITINAGNDFTNVGSDIDATGNVAITVGDDINIDTVKLRNRTEKKWGDKKRGGTKITDATVNLGSEIVVGGIVALTSTGSGHDSEGQKVEEINKARSDKIEAVEREISRLNELASRPTRHSFDSQIRSLNAQKQSINNNYDQQASQYQLGNGSNINVIGSNVRSGSSMTVTARGEVNVISAVDSYYKKETSHKKGLTYSSSTVNITEDNTNKSSNLVSGGDVAITSGNDLNVTASNVSGEGSGSFIAGRYTDLDESSDTFEQVVINDEADANILNAKDTQYKYYNKVETKMSLSLENIAIMAVGIAVAGPWALVVASRIVKKEKLSTTLGSTTETIVKSDLSFVDDLIIATARDLNLKSSDLTTDAGNIALTASNDINITSDSKNDSSYYIGSSNGLFGSNKSDRVDISDITNIGSAVNSGGDLEITAVNDTTLHGSDLKAKNDINIVAGNNLGLLVAQNSHSYSHQRVDETTFNVTYGSTNSVTTNNIQNKILANSDGEDVGEVSFNAGNAILAQYASNSGESLDNPDAQNYLLSKAALSFLTPEERRAAEDRHQQELTKNYITGANDSLLTRDYSQIADLAYTNQLNNLQTVYQQVDDLSISSTSTVRALTETGTAVVAVAVVAAVAAVTIVTAGTGAPAAASAGSAAVGTGAGAAAGATAASTAAAAAGAGAGAAVGATAAVAGTSLTTLALTAAGTAALTTATLSAINASMNTDGDLFKQAKGIGKTTWDDTTSRESIESYAIAAATAALTAGTMKMTGLNGLAANSANLSAPQRVGVALAQSTVSNTVSVATQSAISGESFGDALDNMTKNIVIGAAANLGAQAIGRAVHGETDADNYVLNQDGDRASIAGVEYQQIGKPTQLALHAALGCASGAAGGGDCASGAVSGVVGEMVGENLRPSVESGSMDRQLAIQIAGLAGGYSTIFTGNAVGLDDSEIAQNMYSGQRIGSNAAQNNALYVNKNSQEIIATDKENDHKIILVNNEESDFIEDNNRDGYFSDEVSVISTDYQDHTKGETYDLRNKDDFYQLSLLTGEYGMEYSREVSNILFGDYNDLTRSRMNYANDNLANNNPLLQIVNSYANDNININQNTQMSSITIPTSTNIFFQNGMINNYKSAGEISSLISDSTNRPTGMIVNNTGKGGLDDIFEYLPNELVLRDALNGEIYQQMDRYNLSLGQRSLLITHSAGNNDNMKGNQVLQLTNTRVSTIDVMNVASPISRGRMQKNLDKTGMNILNTYNNIWDPVTNSKTWGVGVLGVGILAAKVAATYTVATSGLEIYFAGVAGAGVGAGVGLVALKLHHPYTSYHNKDFKGLRTDIGNWAEQNPISAR